MRLLDMMRRSCLTVAFSSVLLICGCASTSTQRVSSANQNKTGSPIQNFSIVTSSVLWRGAKPDTEGAKWLIQQGVRTIVNLELLHDDLPAFNQATVENATTYELGYFRIPDWEPLPILAPSVVDDHVAHFLAIVSQQPKPIYVHCRSGENRTGVMVAAYKVIVEGESANEAIKDMQGYQGSWFEADSRYLLSLSPERRDKIRQKITEWIPKLERDAQIVCENKKCIAFKR